MTDAGSIAPAPLVSVVLVNYRMPDVTLDCVASIAKHCRVPFEIIVVDNNSGDDSLAKLRASPVPIVLVPSPVNSGLTGGTNAGARLAKGKYIHILNNDTLLREDAIGILAEFLDNHPEAVAAASNLAFPDGGPQQAAARFPTPLRIFFGSGYVCGILEKRFPSLRGVLSTFIPKDQLTTPCPVDWGSVASLMVRAGAYRAIGGFDEDFFVYISDVELCRRLRAHGEIWLVPGTTVIHLEGASDAIVPRRLGHLAAGWRLYYKKFHSRPGALLCNLADGGGALIKGVTLWIAGRLLRNPKMRHRAAERLTYARNYLKYSYPLKIEG